MKTKQELLKEFIVLESDNYTGDEEYFIAKRSNFEWTNTCDIYDFYGQKCSEENCGCDGEWEDGEVYHTKNLAWSYWDGRNWKTIVIESDGYCDHTEVNQEISLKILEEMPEVPYIEKAYKTIETENFAYTCTRYESDPFIFSVK